MVLSEHCVSLPVTACDSHPERVVLLGQIGQDVGVEHSSLQEAAPQSSQLGAELAHVPADLLCYLLMALLQLMGMEKQIYYETEYKAISTIIIIMSVLVWFSCSYINIH